ncbi:MAG: hypothetical protein HY763_12390 [Planctomycetes bacterium]|nr:hypothetical protein [Planctomycetota bacterium]
MRILVRWAAVLAAGVLGGCSSDSVESAERELVRAWDRHRTLTAERTLVTDVTTDTGTTRTTFVSSFECMKKGDRLLVREEGRTSGMERRTDGATRRIESALKQIHDGEYVYVLTDAFDHQTLYKRKQTIANEAFGGRPLFHTLHEAYTLQRLPDETVDGRLAYVIQAAPKPGASLVTEKVVHYIDKSTGLVLKSITTGNDGRAQTTLTVTNIKVDAPIPAERFVFVPLPGLKAIDLDEQDRLAAELKRRKEHAAAQPPKAPGDAPPSSDPHDESAPPAEREPQPAAPQDSPPPPAPPNGTGVPDPQGGG